MTLLKIPLGLLFMCGFALLFQDSQAVVSGRIDQESVFEETEVQIPNGSIILSGTLTLPSGGGTHPCVVLLAGSGPQARDADAMGFKFFQTLSRSFAQNGIGSLRYDKRGVGKSTGSFGESTLADFADDALAAARFVNSHRKVDSDRIGFCGHSEGGWVAALDASRSLLPDFLILLATSALGVEEADRVQAKAMARAEGTSAQDAQELQSLQQRIYIAARSGVIDETLKQEIRKQVLKRLEKLPEERRPPVGAFLESQIEQLLSPSFRYLLDFDPEAVFQKIQCPTLAIFGELDTVVPAKMNQQEIVAAFRAGGANDFTIELIPKANHFFMEAKTGTPMEIPQLEKSFAPRFLDVVIQWILRDRYPRL